MPASAAAHPSDRRLAAFVNGRLSGTDAEEVERHLETCSECAERLEQLPEERLDGLVREAAVAPDPWAGSASGTEIPMPLLPASRRMSGPWAAVTTSGAFRTEPVHAPPSGYEIICEAGRGGMAIVYKARHVRSRRLVALKMLGGAARDDARELVERFRTEAAALSALNHPHIVAVHKVGRTGDGPFLAMDYVGGGSLALRTGGVPQSPRRAAEWIAAAASAVQAAHRAGIVHRDLKPSNLLLTEDGRLMVTDFGLAKRLGEAGPTRTQQVMGTPGYMAPEQAAGNTRDAGPAADVYALGAVLYELLTGRPPHRATDPLETLAETLRSDPVPPRQLLSSVPAAMEAVCLKCLRREPAERYRDAGTLRADLERWLAGKPVSVRGPSMLQRVLRWTEENSAATGVLAAAGLLFAASAFGAGWLAARETALRPARREAAAVRLELIAALLDQAAGHRAAGREAECLAALGRAEELLVRTRTDAPADPEVRRLSDAAAALRRDR